MGHQIVLQWISFLIFLYVLVLSLRIILPWFGFPAVRSSTLRSTPRWWVWLRRTTAPYLAIFEKIRFLKRGPLDLSPLAGLYVVLVIQSYISLLSYYRVMTRGIALAMFVRAAWQITVWLLLFLFILCLTRTAGLLFDRKNGRAYWTNIDALFRPLNRRRQGNSRSRPAYGFFLLLFAASLVLLWLAGGWATGNLIRLLVRI